MDPAEARARLGGVVVPLVTPFDARGSIDLPAYRALLEFLAEQQVRAVVPGDLVGELYSLTLQERRILLEEAVRVCRGRMLVISLASAPSLEDSVSLARFARERGADAIKLSLHYPWTPPAASMFEMFCRVDDEAQMPFLVESSDDCVIPLEVIVALCDRSRFVGLEEFGSSASRADRIHEAFAGRLAILTSGDNASLNLGLMGASGMIVAESNFAPRAINDFLEACRARQLDRALELYRARRRYRDLFREQLSAGQPMFVPFTKASLDLMRIPVGRPRPPIMPLEESKVEALRATLASSFGIDTR